MEKTYTAAEVAALLAEERAKRLVVTGEKPVTFKINAGTFVPKTGANKGKETPFAHVRIEGNFYPAKLSFAAAEAILANIDGLKAVLAERTKPEAPKVDPLAPRLAARS